MFREMRSKANMLTNEEVENILKTSPNGTLALYGENGYPYSVPVNFVYSDGKIYFHGAAEGYKLDCMKKIRTFHSALSARMTSRRKTSRRCSQA